jgi:PAS domain S-box-containing protein
MIGRDDATGDDRSGSTPEHVALGVLATDDVAFDVDAFEREHDCTVVHEAAPDYSTAARVGASAAEVVVLVPDDETPPPASVLDALRERTTLPVVLYDDDVSPGELEAFLDADATDYVHRDSAGSGLVLAKRVRAAADHATLVESHGLLERAVDQADVGITIADARTDDEPLIYVNEGFARLTGYPVEEAVGRNCRFLQGEGTDPETVARLRESIENEESASVDIKNYHRDGTSFWNHLDISPVFDEDGELTHYFGFQRDVTERKRLATELREQNDRLEAFASVVSHDLRNPLAVARGHLAGMDGEDVPAVEAALDRMDQLITDVLALAREGDAVEETERVSLAEVATYAWSMVDTGDLALDAPTDVVVRADRTRLVSVLENLFRNAVEHADGATTVTVDATADGFVVADDGPGIPDGDRDAVFERGYSTDPDGTGFGLAIVDAIATAHDWSVRVSERDDGGAAFVLAGVSVESGR